MKEYIAAEKPTIEQLQEVENSKQFPVTFDEDCPELSEKMEEAFKRAVKIRDRRNA